MHFLLHLPKLSYGFVNLPVLYNIVNSPNFFFALNFVLILQPAKRHAYGQGGDNVFTPVERELIFDIVS